MQTPRHLTRARSRALPPLIACCGLALTLTACGGSSLGSEGSSDGDDGPVRIGLLVPQSGIYTSLGDDMKNAFEMYVDLNDGQLGGRDVEVILADEGETADSGQAGATKLIKSDDVHAVTGVVSSAVMNAIKDMVEDDGVPLVGSNASPTDLVDVDYIWRTSYVNDEPGIALGEHVANTVDGPVYLIAADYQAGKDEIEGFKETFLPAGGEVADEVYTPFPATTNFQPYLAQIQSSDAAAVFTFYAGGAAVDFVKQYDDYGLAGNIPLYAPGFLTEGGVLPAQGASAEGIFTSMNYSADLDTELNNEFASEYVERYDLEPTTYAMASYDAAAVLDQAIAAVDGDLTRDSINDAIAGLGEIDSPRGPWRFNDGGTPVQTWYLREVADVDGDLKNVAIGELGELGD
ncbi:ABC transporter substrate-binding protein [Phytoactinopolyspora limicola]|uniref:ABC transporter substrate-binding protein n=1 Tax=Phytoactinopolyspora limicola TaxID=2715536 RepID=UPI00140C2339|nr:ABC transporter substrate-binding protein [Phytoactinopolyspora limicola]